MLNLVLPLIQFNILFSSNAVIDNTDDPSSRYSMLEDGTLTIRNTQNSDEGVYTCIASNIAGETRGAHAQLRHRNNVGKLLFLYNSYY